MNHRFGVFPGLLFGWLCLGCDSFYWTRAKALACRKGVVCRFAPEEDFAKLTKAVAGMTDEALAAASGSKGRGA